MTHRYVTPLNELGFEHDGEIVEVTGYEEFSDKVQKKELEETHHAFDREKTVRMCRLRLETGEAIEMQYRNFKNMLNHYEKQK